MHQERIIIDTDPGVDDFLALALALSSDRFIIEGLTIVFGNNTDLRVMAKNAAYALQLTKRKCPIYMGCTKPIERGPYVDSEGAAIHGPNALGGVPYELLPEYEELIKVDMTAADFIVKHIKENPDQVSIITLGPLSNLATAIRQYPELPQYVNRIGIMGGSFFNHGNVTPLAEANIYNDPEAAKIVFNGQWKNSTIAPLNVTHKVNMDEEFLGEIKNIGEIGKTIYFSHKHYINYHNVHFKVTDIPCHDPTPVVYFLYPDIFESITGHVDVETTGKLTSGVTLIDTRGYKNKIYGQNSFNGQSTVLINTNEPQFKKHILQVLKDRHKALHEE
jgi:inosine-uridine nucleoside N-ribohydrolase